MSDDIGHDDPTKNYTLEARPKALDWDAAEELRGLAIRHRRLAFAYLITVALGGEQWAVRRVIDALEEIAELPGIEHMLAVIDTVDTARPSR